MLKWPDNPEALDTATVFRIYAWLAIPAGIFLLQTRPAFGLHLAEIPWGRAAFLRIFACILAGSGLCAIGFAKVQDPADRLRALACFALAHALVFAMQALQQQAIRGDGPAPTIATNTLGAATFLLIYFWYRARGQSMKGALPLDRLRAQYTEEIRESAAREERNRLARDLHDSIKQQIFAIQTSAATVQARIAADPAGANTALDQVRASARAAMAEMEAMLHQLRAEPVENLGLIQSLRGATVELDAIPAALPHPGAFGPGALNAIFRATQKAFSNVARHARPTLVKISLLVDSGWLRLSIVDNGAGFDSAKPSPGMGLGSMRSRLKEVGGQLTNSTAPGAGTTISLAIPFSTVTRSDLRNSALATALLAVVSAAGYVETRSIMILLFAGVAVFSCIRYLIALNQWKARN